MQFKTANKINGYKPVSYGMTVKKFKNIRLTSFRASARK
jgi:hypothetical protein